MTLPWAVKLTCSFAVTPGSITYLAEGQLFSLIQDSQFLGPLLQPLSHLHWNNYSCIKLQKNGYISSSNNKGGRRFRMLQPRLQIFKQINSTTQCRSLPCNQRCQCTAVATNNFGSARILYPSTANTFLSDSISCNTRGVALTYIYITNLEYHVNASRFEFPPA